MILHAKILAARSFPDTVIPGSLGAGGAVRAAHTPVEAGVPEVPNRAPITLDGCSMLGPFSASALAFWRVCCLLLATNRQAAKAASSSAPPAA